MITTVIGTLEARTAEHAIVRIGGIGLKVWAPTGTLADLGAVGQVVRLHTHLYVRQDTLALYGFASEEELNTFELLLGVSGIGPKAGIAILSSAPLDVLRVAIATGDAEPLTRIPGIGKKMAARIVLELAGKIVQIDADTARGAASVADAEVLAALTSLGYTTSDAQAALRATSSDGGATIEERIIAALRYFASR